MSEQTCATNCGRPTRDVRMLCDQCVWELEQALAEMPALLDDLDTTLTRQARFGSSNGGSPTKGKTQPLPYDVRASDIIEQLRIVLTGWTMVLVEDRRESAPANRLNAMSRFLLKRLDLLATHEAAADIHSEITDAAAAGRRAIDRPPDRIYAGRCGGECDEDLYARPGAAAVICQACDTAHDVATRRETMLAELDGMLLTVAEIVHLATYLGQDIQRKRTRNLLDQWVARGRLVAHSVDRDGRALYPFGETLRAVLAAPTRPTKVA